MHIHLDLVGGLSGDMFIGAMLDCFPTAAASLPRVMEAAGFSDLVRFEISAFDDGILTGTRVKVIADRNAEGHDHRHFSEIKKILIGAKLDSAVHTHALGIFQILAEAEASIHGTTVDHVAFHEVGAWDSIADIIIAAHLISSVSPASWSIGTLPLGRGQVKTAHGMLPIPAPATALILHGFEFVDDGIEGERITPTGAAILKYLAPSRSVPPSLILANSGHGFGSRRFPSISNVVRALVFEPASNQLHPWHHDQVLEIAFELDDQTPEQIATAVDQIRLTPGVLDVVQTQLAGKKGRQMIGIRLLAQPDSEDAVITACFNETTTLGLRRQLVTRLILPRHDTTVERGQVHYRVKVAERPGGITAKLEQDHLANTGLDQSKRDALRHELEQAAIREHRQDE